MHKEPKPMIFEKKREPPNINPNQCNYLKNLKTKT